MLAQEMHARYAGAQLSFNTMDPTSQIGLGADTKMLRAGWGSWGAPASQATISADYLRLPTNTYYLLLTPCYREPGDHPRRLPTTTTYYYLLSTPYSLLLRARRPSPPR